MNTDWNGQVIQFINNNRVLVVANAYIKLFNISDYEASDKYFKTALLLHHTKVLFRNRVQLKIIG